MEPDPNAAPGSAARFTDRQLRILKIAVVVMGLVLIVGFVVLLVGIFYQASQVSERSAAKKGAGVSSAFAPTVTLPVAPGATVSHMALDGNRLAVHLSGSGGAQIVVIDLASGRIVSRVRIDRE